MGVLSGSTNTASGTIITIPSGQTWQGSLAVSLGSTVDSLCTIQVTDGGTGVQPAAGTNLVGTTVKVPALSTGNNSAAISDVYVIAGSADANLKLIYSGGGSSMIYGSATGSY